MPHEVRVLLLARDCSKDIEKAEELMSRHLLQQHDVTAVVAVDIDQASYTTGEDDFSPQRSTKVEERSS
jgi:hypothetical protein